MKKITSMVLSLVLLVSCFGFTTFAASGETFSFVSEKFSFTLELPADLEDVLEISEPEKGVSFIFKPSVKDGWGGSLPSIQVFSPRSSYLLDSTVGGTVIAMGTDCVYVLMPVVGGFDSGADTAEAHKEAAKSFTSEYLRANLHPDSPDSMPQVNFDAHYAYLDAQEGGALRPDDAMTRAELAVMLYTLISADNKKSPGKASFSDIDAGLSCAEAVGYLESYGIVSGYPDGTFLPEKAVTRAEVSVILHRFLFAPAEDEYDLSPDFTDISSHWARSHIVSAFLLEWIVGYPDGTFKPDGEITRAEAVTVINRLLGRDESETTVKNPAGIFSDLPESHWAYANLLEAAGKIA